MGFLRGKCTGKGSPQRENIRQKVGRRKGMRDLGRVSKRLCREGEKIGKRNTWTKCTLQK